MRQNIYRRQFSDHWASKTVFSFKCFGICLHQDSNPVLCKVQHLLNKVQQLKGLLNLLNYYLNSLKGNQFHLQWALENLKKSLDSRMGKIFCIPSHSTMNFIVKSVLHYFCRGGVNFTAFLKFNVSYCIWQ